MVEVRWTADAQVVRRYGDALVIFRGEIIKTFLSRELAKAKSYARGWNSVTKDQGKFSSGGGKRIEK